MAIPGAVSGTQRIEGSMIQEQNDFPLVSSKLLFAVVCLLLFFIAILLGMVISLKLDVEEQVKVAVQKYSHPYDPNKHF